MEKVCGAMTLIVTPKGNYRLNGEELKRYLEARRSKTLWVPDHDLIVPNRAKSIDPAVAAETKRRFEICKTCPESLEDAGKCKHYGGCCFGHWRGIQANHCAEGKW